MLSSNQVLTYNYKKVLENKLYNESFLFSNFSLKFVSTVLEKKFINRKMIDY